MGNDRRTLRIPLLEELKQICPNPCALLPSGGGVSGGGIGGAGGGDDFFPLTVSLFHPQMILSKPEKNIRAIYHIERIHTAK